MKYFMFFIGVLFLMQTEALAFLKEGDSLPHQLEAIDQNGVKQSFDKVKDSSGLIIIFVRSADWCPYCQRQLIDMNKSHKEILELGYGLTSVSYDSVNELAKFSKKHSISYPMLSDTNSEIIKAFDILNKDIKEESKGYGIPHPAVYIIDDTGEILARFAEEGYKKRPPSSLILDVLKKLEAGNN